MAEAAKDQDQSMEDILQSIKRIIAEEGDPAPAAESDVLELTERLAEDGSVSQVTPKEEPAPQTATMSIEDIMAAPISSDYAPTPAPAPAPAAAPVSSEDSLMSSSTLSASVAALNALRDSMTPSATPPRTEPLSFRSGTTVEDLALEALRPMLKEWLDANLPRMVETLVRKEISKLTQ